MAKLYTTKAVALGFEKTPETAAVVERLVDSRLLGSPTRRVRSFRANNGLVSVGIIRPPYSLASDQV